MHTRRLLALASTLALACLGAAQAQTVLYTTLPGSDGGAPCFGGGNLAAVQLLTPEGDPTQLNSAVVYMRHVEDGNAALTLTLYTDNAGQPGTSFAVLGTAAGTGVGTINNYTLTPASAVILPASTNFWVVASSTSTENCAFGWLPSTAAPSGTIGYVREKLFSNGIWSSRILKLFALELRGSAAPAAAAVPVPVPTLSAWALLALAGALGTLSLRRLRKG